MARRDLPKFNGKSVGTIFWPAIVIGGAGAKVDIVIAKVQEHDLFKDASEEA